MSEIEKKPKLEEIKPNSKKSKEIKKVTTGKVRQKKPSLAQKFTETFIGEDVDNVGNYLFFDVIVPALKNTITDLVSGGIEMLLYGNSGHKRPHIGRSGGQSYVSYSGYSSSGNRSRNSNSRHRDEEPRRPGGKRREDYRDYEFAARGDAEAVLEGLVEVIMNYDEATVRDLNELIGIESNYTDEGYGWTDVRDARVVRTRGGYSIDLPRPRSLD
jgi:hypothetical protein